MKLRIQPIDIDVPQDDPFRNDQLDRKEFVEAMTNVLRSTIGPGVLAVDSPWGTGKTVFLKMTAAHLRQNGFTVVEFNAWETDFAETPFLALAAEVSDALPKGGTLRQGFERAANELLRRVPGMLSRLALSALPALGDQLVKEANSMAEAILEDPAAKYRATKALLKSFRSTLEDAAKESSEDEKPLVVVIDELDRCRPSYAVQLLEIAKHFFSAEHVIFVLGVNRPQLEHSVQALYGNKFDAHGYLGRFIDADYSLPLPDRTKFINALVDNTGIEERLKPATCSPTDPLRAFYGNSDLDLREVAQAIHRFVMALASLSEEELRVASTLVVLSIMRALHPQAYQDFISGRSTDQDAVEAMFSTPGAKPIRDGFLGHAVEALILIGRLGPSWGLGNTVPDNGPLLRQYQELNESEPSDEPLKQAEKLRAQGVINAIRALLESGFIQQGYSSYSYIGIGFDLVVRRLELFEHEQSPNSSATPILSPTQTPAS